MPSVNRLATLILEDYMKTPTKLIASFALLACFSSAFSQTLFAASAAGGAGELYTLDPTTGAMVLDIGALNDVTGANYGVTGLAFNPITGVLYGSSSNSNATTRARLITIDINTALVTEIGLFNAGPVNGSGVPSTMGDIAFDAAGNLYGVGTIGGPQLYSINTTTGQATVIGSTGLTSTTGGGLAISSGGVFYGTPTSTRFGTYDSGTGAFTNIANPTKPVGGAYAGLAFNGSGTLYGLNLGAGSPPPSHLVTIDPLTGNVTDLGESVGSLDAIAFQAVPEPATMVVLSLGALAATRRKRKPRK